MSFFFLHKLILETCSVIYLQLNKQISMHSVRPILHAANLHFPTTLRKTEKPRDFFFVIRARG